MRVLCILLHKSSDGHILPFSLDKYLGVELLGHMVNVYLFNFIRHAKTAFQSGL